ncbi:MAG: hypothetical protein SGJ10_08365 [Bacteroidota bacterium]|nr:hypothetical protein [Bacteroidota bacterium]
MKKIFTILSIFLILDTYGQKSSVGIQYQMHLSKPHIPRGTTINGERHFTEDSIRFINPRLGYIVQGSYIYKINKYFRVQTGLSFSKYSTRIVYLSFTPPPNSRFFSSVVNTLTYKFTSIPIVANGVLPVNNSLSLSGSFFWSFCLLKESYWDSYDYSYYLTPFTTHEKWNQYEEKYNRNIGYNIGFIMKASSQFKISIHFQKSVFKDSQSWLFDAVLLSKGINIGLEYQLSDLRKNNKK